MQMGILVEETLLAARILSTTDGVDPARIGVTGMSLGGNATWYSMACAPWIAAGVPVCGGVGSLPANQFRLFLHSAAYALLHALRSQGLKGTAWTKAQFNTIQNRFLKIGARVIESARRIRFHFPTSYPLKNVLVSIVTRLETNTQ